VGARVEETIIRLNTVGFIVTLVLLTLWAPLAVDAQQPAKVARIGYLALTQDAQSLNAEAFRQGLRDLGYVEGQNLVIERRSAEGRTESLRDLAAELVRLQVDVIVTGGDNAARVALQATRTIPIVIAGGGDPVGLGLVASLARPGGNITGLSMLRIDLAGKRLEILKEAVPTASRVAVLFNPASIGAVLQWRETEGAARALGVQLHALEVRHADELEQAFDTATSEGVGALIVFREFLFGPHRTRILHLVAKSRLPVMYEERDFVDAGGLMSYGPSRADIYRRAAGYVHKILKGAKPADLPVEQAMKFELVINLKTAKALGITFPPTLLVLADEVIQ
jgi:putative ABC transport system substrate-binding protein